MGDADLSFFALPQKLKAAVDAHPVTQENVGDFPACLMPRDEPSIILADPNWKFKTRSAKGSLRKMGRNYDADDWESFCQLPVASACAPDALLFLWAPREHVFNVAEVIKGWGFRPSARVFEWVKTTNDGSRVRYGGGYSTRSCAESMYLGIKNAGLPRLRADVPDVIHHRRLAPSQKPEIFQTLIELMYGEQIRVEFYARRHRPGWWCSGLELDGILTHEAVGKLKERDPEETTPASY
jgi:N6-adenosine-specific RNA methylase IME4